MSSSLLYHGFGVRGCRHVSFSYREGRVGFRIEQPREGLLCSARSSDDLVFHGCQERDFPTLPIGQAGPGDPAHPPRRLPGVRRRPAGQG